MDVSPSTLSEIEARVSEILRESAAKLTDHWQLVKTVSFKEHVDPVTEFDVQIENELRAKLTDLLPEAGFIVEEGVTNEEKELNWVIDPIDQTKNFVGQIPLFYSQVALLNNGTPVLGVIFNPVSGQLFSASLQNGAKLNSRPLNVACKSQLSDALIDIDFGGTLELAWKVSALQRLADTAFRIRVTGGSYAPYLLTGGIDVFIILNEKTKLVDQMPRMALIREAGLRFDAFTVDGHDIFIAGRDEVVQQALEVIKNNN